jgi:hypothetical protein
VNSNELAIEVFYTPSGSEHNQKLAKICWLADVAVIFTKPDSFEKDLELFKKDMRHHYNIAYSMGIRKFIFACTFMES